jgi:hypothetical protein
VKSAALPSLAFAGISLSFDNHTFLGLQNFFQVSLEQDAQEIFTDVVMKTSMRVPVVLKVGSSHVRVTSVSFKGRLSFPDV